mmetsp:Transcript_399/g.580  ORF Transcript_399/g.580 Transcript_399/m.580 type:complete len:88 (-) Transcript_399:389-652(-)
MARVDSRPGTATNQILSLKNVVAKLENALIAASATFFLPLIGTETTQVQKEHIILFIFPESNSGSINFGLVLIASKNSISFTNWFFA